jgi:hypothetical protein
VPRTSVKYSCRLTFRLCQARSHVPVMNHSTSPQVKHLLPHTAIAGAAALPMSKVGPGMLDRATLAQLRAPWRGPLALAPRRPQGFIGMPTDATPPRTGRATLTQRAGRTGGGWKRDCPAWLAGPDSSPRTLPGSTLPSQMAGALGKIRPWRPWPCLADNGPRLTPVWHQRARQGRSVAGPCGQRALVRGQVGC